MKNDKWTLLGTVILCLLMWWGVSLLDVTPTAAAMTGIALACFAVVSLVRGFWSYIAHRRDQLTNHNKNDGAQ